MEISYRRLCTISFKHDYYRDNRKCKDLKLNPTHLSIEIMKQFGLILKSIDGKTVLLQKMDGANIDTPINENICLIFNIELNNPLFYNVTEVYNKRNFYFTNLADDGTLKDRLTIDLNFSEKDVLPKFTSQNYSESIIKGTIQKLSFEQITQLPFSAPIVYDILPNVETVEIKLNKPSKYRISKTPAENPEIIYANDEIKISSNFFGVIDLFLNDTIQAETNFEINFELRKFKLQYFLVDVKNKVIKFEDPDKIKLSFFERNTDSFPQPGFDFIYNNNPTPDLKKILTDIRDNNQANVNNVYLFEANKNVSLLENKPSKVEMGLVNNNNFKMQLPFPDITNIQIRMPTLDAEIPNAMIFHNI